MTDRSIASRPSLEQVIAIVDFMEKNPELAQSQLRGVEGREHAKTLWAQLTDTLNSLTGPTREMKSWIKYWADKKSSVKSKVQSGGGDSNSLGSNMEKKIWDLFLATDTPSKVRSPKSHSVKEANQSEFLADTFFNEDSIDDNHEESETVLTFQEPVLSYEERHMAVMDKLLKVMGDQALAMTQLAHASHSNSQAMERLAEASQIQARALDRLATTFESISAATHETRNAIVEIERVTDTVIGSQTVIGSHTVIGHFK